MSILTPILPFYSETFHASSTELVALYSSYSAMLFLASLFRGKFSDIFGRKPMICFSLFGTASGFLVCGLAQNYGQLLAARFFTGIFGATVTIIFISTYIDIHSVYICIGTVQQWINDVVPSIKDPIISWNRNDYHIIIHCWTRIGAGLAEFGIRVPFYVSSGLGTFDSFCNYIYQRNSS